LEEGEKLLSDCKEGDQVVIRRLIGGGPLRRRLLEMGFTPGTAVRVVKYAPLRDPLECEIKGYHIALRVSEALWIVVE
jgi:Fe2+ transport system protein FeoA